MYDVIVKQTRVKLQDKLAFLDFDLLECEEAQVAAESKDET